jgi:maltodextrin utilization protein YvdJ
MEAVSQMLELNGIQLSILEVFLMASVMLLAVFSFVNQRRVSRLELLLSSSQTATSREIKMVNQGAIGLGRRFARIEKELKKPSNVARFEAPKETTPSQFKPVAQAVSKPVKQQPKAIKPKTLGKATRAEQALSAWINENKTA